MIAFRILLALILFPLASPGEEPVLPVPPSGQVLDQNEWLDLDQRNQLESELTRFRQSHDVDVLVVIWNQALDPGTDLKQLARRLGKTWSRENLWALVLHHPDSEAPPIAAWGGNLLEDLGKPSPEGAFHDALARGLKEWTDQDRVSGIALNLGEEMVFLQLQQRTALKAHKQQQATALAAAKQNGRAKTIRYSLITLASLITVALGTAGWIRYRSRPTSFQFPKTRWRRRLGASWSGGSNLVSSFTPHERK